MPPSFKIAKEHAVIEFLNYSIIAKILIGKKNFFNLVGKLSWLRNCI